MSVKVANVQNNETKTQPSSKSADCYLNVNTSSNNIININAKDNNAGSLVLHKKFKMSMKNRDIDKDDIMEYSPPSKPVDISSLSIQYSTCNLFIHGFMRETISNFVIKVKHIKHKTLQFICKIIENYSYKSLIVSSGETIGLYPKTEFVYNYVIIENDAIVTSQNQGIIMIKCFDMILHQNAVLHLNGKGYHGGLPERQGGSYQGNSGVFTASKHANYGGGGGGILFGGGGGYGTKGKDADYRYVYKSGEGGQIYGDTKELDYDENLNHFYMGSGGGGGYNDGHKKIKKKNKIKIGCGGSGGGGLHLNILGNLHLMQSSLIQCNGLDGYKAIDCGGGGGGSGGSILIHLNNTYNMIMEYDSHLQAIGGCGATKECGNGGYGRIRIKFRNGDNNIRLPKNVKPKPYIG